MADDQTTPVVEPTPSDPTGADTPPPDDDSAETPTTACADGTDEDPEEHIGDEIKDPWDDAFQTDWPQNEVAPE